MFQFSWYNEFLTEGPDQTQICEQKQRAPSKYRAPHAIGPRTSNNSRENGLFFPSVCTVQKCLRNCRWFSKIILVLSLATWQCPWHKPSYLRSGWMVHLCSHFAGNDSRFSEEPLQCRAPCRTTSLSLLSWAHMRLKRTSSQLSSTDMAQGPRCEGFPEKLEVFFLSESLPRIEPIFKPFDDKIMTIATKSRGKIMHRHHMPVSSSIGCISACKPCICLSVFAPVLLSRAFFLAPRTLTRLAINEWTEILW
jgi:hypothetical protein